MLKFFIIISGVILLLSIMIERELIKLLLLRVISKKRKLESDSYDQETSEKSEMSNQILISSIIKTAFKNCIAISVCFWTIGLITVMVSMQFYDCVPKMLESDNAILVIGITIIIGLLIGTRFLRKRSWFIIVLAGMVGALSVYLLTIYLA